MIWKGARFARRIAVSASVVVTYAMFAGHAVAANCETKPPTINFSFETPAPVLDNTLPQPKLQQLADSKGTQRHQGRTLGLYTSRLQYELKADFKVVPVGNGVCLLVDTVNVRWRLAERRIYVTTEWKPGTCPYTAILAHERKHEETDERVLRERTPPAKRRITDALTHSKAPVAPSQRDAERDRLAKLVDATASKVFSDVAETLKKAQTAVDGGLEYSRVAASCSDFRNGPIPRS